jgi:hypothetical protein
MRAWMALRYCLTRTMIFGCVAADFKGPYMLTRRFAFLGCCQALVTKPDEAALRTARMLIGGKWVESASGESFEVEDPAHISLSPRTQSIGRPRKCPTWAACCG